MSDTKSSADFRVPDMSLNVRMMAEVAQPHAGLVREELLLLNYMFGLSQNSSFQIPISIPDLANTTIKDVVFVAFDTEVSTSPGGDIYLGKRFQVGISIFDTRSLQQISSADQTSSFFEQQTENAFQSFSLCFGKAEYCAKVSRKFLFGASESVLPDQVKPKLEELVARDRNIVLVVHGGFQDLYFLKAMEIDFKPVCIIDTQKAAQTVLHLARRCSLEGLLAALCCPFKYTHIAGNDANFTLRALLMIAVMNSQGLALSDSHRALLSTLQAIAQSTRFNSGVWLDNTDEEDWLAQARQGIYGTLEERQAKNRRKKARKQERKLHELSLEMEKLRNQIKAEIAGDAKGH